MKIKIKQLRRIIRESILQEYSIINGPYEPHVNKKKHAQAMRDVEYFARDIANTTGPGLALERMAYSYPDFVEDCESRALSNNMSAGEVPEEIFIQCAIDYCHDFSEKQINKFLTAMRT